MKAVKQNKIIPNLVWNLPRLPLSFLNGGFFPNSSVGQALPDNVWAQTSPSPSRVLAAQAGPREGFFSIPTLFTRERASCSLRPWRSLARCATFALAPWRERVRVAGVRGYIKNFRSGEGAACRMRRYHVGQALPDNAPKGHLSLFTRPSSSRSVLMRDIGASHGIIPGHAGFTLIEILVVVLIIGILGAIMLPQYQRAVLKSRYASLMPIAKAMADSNEAYFLEHGVYADNAQDLPVQGRQNYPDGTEIEFGTDTDYSYVLATRGNDFPNNYIVYQKHSGQYPGEIHCEAAANDTQAQEVCKSFGPTQDIGETLTPNYLTYVLSGTGNGVAPTGEEGSDDNPGGTSGTSTDPEPQTPPVTKMSAEEAQAIADEKCKFPSYGCVGIANDDGTVSVCENRYGSVDEETDECVSNGVDSGRAYESVYNPDGTKKQESICGYDNVSGGHCYLELLRTYNSDGSYTQKDRQCADKAAINHLVCANETYQARSGDPSSSNVDRTYNADGQELGFFSCSAIGTDGECTAYKRMSTYDRIGSDGYVQNLCVSISTTNPTTCNTYKPVYAYSVNGASLGCMRDGGSTDLDWSTGSCPSGSWKRSVYDSSTNKYVYTQCSSYESINWTEGTCS